MRAVLPNLIFILPAVTLQRRILIFWFGPLGGLYECLEMLQGVWGRVPVALSHLSCMRCCACDLPPLAVERRER